MNYQEISSKVANIIKGQFGIYVVVKASCDKKLLKGGAHYMGRIEKVTMINNARLGVSYKGMVETKASKEFTPQPLRGFTWLVYPFFKQADKSGKIYLNINYRQCDARTSFKSVYLLDGRVATDDEVNDFTQYFKGNSSQPKTQIAVGVSAADATSVVTYDIDGVSYVGTSKEDAIKVFSELTK